MKSEIILELLMELPFKQCTCNNPTIKCDMCDSITKIREHIRHLLKENEEFKRELHWTSIAAKIEAEKADEWNEQNSQLKKAIRGLKTYWKLDNEAERVFKICQDIEVLKEMVEEEK